MFINETLSYNLQRAVCGHELGHDRLHRKFALHSFLHDIMLIDMTTKPECEANLFASMLLIDGDKIEQLLSEDYTVSQIAGELGVAEELVLFRVSEMMKENTQLRLPRVPRVPRGDFLK